MTLPPTLDGKTETIERPAGTVHLLTGDDRAICDPARPAMQLFDGVYWQGVGLSEAYCPACEGPRQREGIGRQR
ncbi:MAG TPA: hypothetical protein VM121_09065 [Acidimicrobiales bacterium]|nr:hypothetical protein [Acidimicrobiales bacterium]